MAAFECLWQPTIVGYTEGLGKCLDDLGDLGGPKASNWWHVVAEVSAVKAHYFVQGQKSHGWREAQAEQGRFWEAGSQKLRYQDSRCQYVIQCVCGEPQLTRSKYTTQGLTKCS